MSILVLNGQAIAIVLKCFSKNSIVANAAAGVSFIDARETQKYVSLDEVKNVETCAIEATKVHELMFAGVDIIISKNNENYVIECNRNPQFIETQRVLPDIDIANQVIKCLENPSEWAI